MTFEVCLKSNIASEISLLTDSYHDKITVTSLDITNGLLKKGSYYIPVEHILFIKEV